MKWLASILMVGVFMVGNGCDNRKQGERSDAEQMESAWRSKKLAWGKEHNAVVGWKTNIPSRDALFGPFSIDATKALIQSNGIPLQGNH
jgi:hypothetical protein